MLKIGMDELATEKQFLTGYTYIMLDSNAHNHLNQEFLLLKSTYTNKKTFHGKRYKSADRLPYKKFLEIIKSSIEFSTPSLLCVTLNKVILNNDINASHEKFNTDIIEKIPLEVDKHSLQIINSFIPYIFTFQRVCDHMQIGNLEASIDIDSDDIKKKLSSAILKKELINFKGAWYLKNLCNTYKNIKFPGAPTLNDNIIPMPDSKSVLIQAADVFASFLLSHVFVLAGDTISKKKKEKSELLLEVFGDKINIHDSLLKQIKRIGETDLDLDTYGAITYRYPCA